MSVEFTSGSAAISEFVVHTDISDTSRERAAIAFIDTVGVMLAGAGEPAARIAQALAADEGTGECRVLGTEVATSAGWAVLANGVAAHALDYDDMCFVSPAHPSCVLVPAILAVGEIAHASARSRAHRVVRRIPRRGRAGDDHAARRVRASSGRARTAERHQRQRSLALIRASGRSKSACGGPGGRWRSACDRG